MKRRIVLLGPPASGKGTQAEMIQERFGIPTVSPGLVLREEAASGSDLGRRAAEYTSKGRLVPDEVAVAVVRGWLARNDGKFVFDGFPRSVGQAEALDQMLSERATPLDVAFSLEVGDEVIRRRVLSRRVCGECRAIVSVGLHVPDENAPCPRCGGPLIRRSDDNLEALQTRMEEYRTTTLPLVPFFEERGLLVRIDASREPAPVFDCVARELT